MKTSLLWFDVEKRYNTTCVLLYIYGYGLWFDVEKRYNTTKSNKRKELSSCGLM